MNIQEFVTGLTFVLGAVLLFALCAACAGWALGTFFDRIAQEVDRQAYERYERRMQDCARYCFPHTRQKRFFELLAGAEGYKEPWEIFREYPEMKGRTAE